MKGQKAQPVRVKIAISGRAFDQVVKHSERYRISVEDVLDQIIIDLIPMPKGPPRCSLCNAEGHLARKCPNQLTLI